MRFVVSGELDPLSAVGSIRLWVGWHVIATRGKRRAGANPQGASVLPERSPADWVRTLAAPRPGRRSFRSGLGSAHAPVPSPNVEAGRQVVRQRAEGGGGSVDAADDGRGERGARGRARAR